MSVRPRARDLGIEIGLLPVGPGNAITDVAGVRVGHATLIAGDGPLVVGAGPVRTGVTVIVPPGVGDSRAMVAGTHTLNGNGEMTGLEWIREAGLLTTPIGITNTHSVGVVRDALIAAEIRGRGSAGDSAWSLPVVAETYDGMLNDMDGQHVRAEHVFAALDAAADGRVGEGSVGGGTGMICHELKGGIGTSSRVIRAALGGHTVGVLVQANHGRRERLTIGGDPVGRRLPYSKLPSPYDDAPAPGAASSSPAAGDGSIIVVVATDAPLLAHQCRAVAQRAGLGIARVGGAGEATSGDIFLAFSTANSVDPSDVLTTRTLSSVGDRVLSELYWATIEATEEAIVNALVAAETMTGRDGITAHELPHETITAGAPGRR